MSKFFNKLLGKESRKEKEARLTQEKRSGLPDAELRDDDIIYRETAHHGCAAHSTVVCADDVQGLLAGDTRAVALRGSVCCFRLSRSPACTFATLLISRMFEAYRSLTTKDTPARYDTITTIQQQDVHPAHMSAAVASACMAGYPQHRQTLVFVCAGACHIPPSSALDCFNLSVSSSCS